MNVVEAGYAEGPYKVRGLPPCSPKLRTSKRNSPYRFLYLATQCNADIRESCVVSGLQLGLVILALLANQDAALFVTRPKSPN